MTDWKRGGPSGSLNRWVRKEVVEQLRNNPVAKAARYNWSRRALRGIFAIGTFGRFVSLYLIVDLAMMVFEAFWPSFARPGLFPWTSDPTAVEIVKTVPSYLIGAQVGILGMISLALALVTLIAQREEAPTDVQVYYHESLFFEITASCLALVAILGAQLVWPLQSILHILFGSRSEAGLFKLVLLLIHLGWFLLNMAAVAHFIKVTFRFVQRDARALMRESYTANNLLPRELTQLVTDAVYLSAGVEAVPKDGQQIDTVSFGQTMFEPYEVEMQRHFKHPARVKNVHVLVALWAIRRWKARCDKAAPPDPDTARALGSSGRARLCFTPRVGEVLRGDVEWCRRNGGVALDRIEKFALGLAFRFERARYAN